MSRRDMIIIAVLLNAGLLIILFATSLKTGNDEMQPQIAVATPKVEEQSTPTLPVADEVDQMLRQYTTPPVAISTEPSAPNFAADLQAIAAPVSPEIVAAPTSTLASTFEQASVNVEEGFKEIKVKKGDVLERIARNHHVKVDDIMKLNALSSTRLKIGQTLKIPNKSGTKSHLDPISEGAVKYYTIKVGDNPWTIAVKNHMKVEELLKLNNLDDEKARRLKPGDKIRIK
jgi:peptidoglycan endopeptidase LytF